MTFEKQLVLIRTMIVSIVGTGIAGTRTILGISTSTRIAMSTLLSQVPLNLCSGSHNCAMMEVIKLVECNPPLAVSFEYNSSVHSHRAGH